MVLRKLYVPEQRMTFGGHLEELRQRIINSILAVVLAGFIGLAFLQDFLFNLALGPYQRASVDRVRVAALQAIDRSNAVLAEIAALLPALSPEELAPLFPEADREAVIREGLRERALEILEATTTGDRVAALDRFLDASAGNIVRAVREQLLLADAGENLSVRVEVVDRKLATVMEEQGSRLRGFFSASSAEKAQDLFRTLVPATRDARAALRARPEKDDPAARAKGHAIARDFARALEGTERSLAELATGKGAKIVAIRPTEQFLTYLKLVMIAALFMAHPFVIWQAWRFIGAGLYVHEQRIALTFVPFSIALFIVGAVFGYTILIPFGLSYLSSYGDPELVDTMFSLSAYLSFFMSLTLLLGLIFQLPLVMFFVARSGVVDPSVFSRFRRHAILIGVIVAAVLTPPDPFTQILLAIPLIGLYEIGVQISKIGGRRAREAEKAADDGGEGEAEEKRAVEPAESPASSAAPDGPGRPVSGAPSGGGEA